LPFVLKHLLDGAWSVLMYTDGLIEGRIGAGPDRLGSEGLMNLITGAQPDALTDDQLLDRVVDQVRKLNQGDLDDDLAVLALGYRPPEPKGPWAPRRRG
jgi:serine phosphatase RsbU (regulator of sigma subunit)